MSVFLFLDNKKHLVNEMLIVWNQEIRGCHCLVTAMFDCSLQVTCGGDLSFY